MINSPARGVSRKKLLKIYAAEGVTKGMLFGAACCDDGTRPPAPTMANKTINLLPGAIIQCPMNLR